jgi:hypothetical protein
MDVFLDYRTALMVDELARRYGDLWVAPSLLPEVAAISSTPHVNVVLSAIGLGVVIWGMSLVVIARFFGFSATRNFSLFVLLGVAVFLLSLSIYGGVAELHLAYKIQMVQELEWFDQIQEHTGLIPTAWGYDWSNLQSMDEWKSLHQGIREDLIHAYQLNHEATHYLQRNVWGAWPQQGITWMLQIIPYEASLWETVGATNGKFQHPTRPSLLFGLIGLLLLSVAGWLLFKSYQEMRSARLITLLTDATTDSRSAGLQSIQGTVYSLAESLSISESTSKLTAHLHPPIASVNSPKVAASWRQLFRYHHSVRSIEVTGGRGEAFCLRSPNGANMGVSLEGAVFLPSRNRFKNTSTGSKAYVQVGDHLWVLGLSHMDMRAPHSTTFESSGRFVDSELSAVLRDVLGTPATLIVTHYAPDDIKAMLSQRGFSWLGGALICSWLAILFFVNGLMGLSPSSILAATLGNLIAVILVEYFQGASLLRTKADFLKLATKQLANQAQKRQPLMAALRDCLDCKEESLSSNEKSRIQALMSIVKDCTLSPEKALSGSKELADQCEALHEELAGDSASTIRKRAIQLLFQEAQHIQQQQRALLRSENLLNEQRNRWRWRIISGLVVPSTLAEKLAR